jgi:hypothetical protein
MGRFRRELRTRGEALTTDPHLALSLSTSRATSLLPLCAFRGMSRGDLYLYEIYKDILYTQHGAEENKVSNDTDCGNLATLFQRLRSGRMTVGVINSKVSARKWQKPIVSTVLIFARMDSGDSWKNSVSITSFLAEIRIEDLSVPA